MSSEHLTTMPHDVLLKAVNLHRSGSLDEAETLYRTLFASSPKDPLLLNLLGMVCAGQGRYEEGIKLMGEAIAMKPDYADAYKERGAVLYQLKRYDEALASYDKAIAFNPNDAELYYNCAVILEIFRRHSDALAQYNKAIALNPEYVSAHWNKGLLELLLGNYEEGWKLFEWRLKKPDLVRTWIPKEPLWLGKESLKGKTIVLYAEYGLGDTLQFCRYVPLVEALGAKVILGVPTSMVGLMSTLKGSPALLGEGAHPMNFDFQCPLMSLPLAFGTRVETIPSEPYLKAQPEFIEKWRPLLNEKLGSTSYRIGLCWAGGQRPDNPDALCTDAKRSFHFTKLKPLLDIKNVSFVSLQLGPPKDQIDDARVTDISADLKNWSDTAAVISLLDLVITVDTSVCHLAGALGKKTWMLNRYDTCWRWFLDRDDSPWYPTLTQFRQQTSGDWESVIAKVKTALEKLVANPINADVLNQQAIFELQRGNLKVGIGLLDQVIALQPNHIEAYYNHGTALYTLKRYNEALTSYDKAIAVNPRFAQAYYNRGMALYALQRYDEAVISYDKAIQINPNYADAYSNRGAALYELKRHKEALASYDKAVALNPDFTEAYSNRGVTLLALKRCDEAVTSYDKALAIRPDYAEGYFNRGAALHELRRYDEALANYDKAIALNPDYAEAYYNRGAALFRMKRYSKALVNYDKTIALNPDHTEVHYSKGLLKLLLGEYEEGWRLHEWRWKTKNLSKEAKVFSKPFWSGRESLAGKTILLYTEQGFGDAIQFCRYVPLVETLGAKVILGVYEPLHGLLSTLRGSYRLLENGEQFSDFDFQCPLMSLPLAFGTTVHTIPADVSYLYADPDKQKTWQERLGKKTRLRIGLTWSGNAQHINDLNRSIALSLLSPLLEYDADFYSLQKEIRPEEKEIFASSNIISYADNLRDFTDTAALVAEMDIVISVDTSIAHLAGALGKPVWVLLPFAPDFRWLLEREDSPWYPTARLFRQQQQGDWESVIARVKAALKLTVPQETV